MRNAWLLLALGLGVGCLAPGCATTSPPAAAKDAAPASAAPLEQIDKVVISEFILGAGDTFDVEVYRNETLNRTVKLDRSGKFMFPLVGDVEAAGKSIFALRDEIQARLARYLVNPQVTINLTGLQSQKVFVLGEVKNPGVFSLDSNISLVEAISKAGGVTDNGKKKSILLIHKGETAEQASIHDLDATIDGGGYRDRLLDSGDVVYVPKKTIASVSWYFAQINQILSPIVNLELGVVLWPKARDVFSGEDSESTSVSVPVK